ncbi:MAG: 10 kDa chaperonin 5 [Chlamydiia bacterium]|nr:10 kDa chaperonin 5 [Chlamydiia bacterium]
MGQIKPLMDRVLVRQVDAEEKTVGGIYIPDNAKEKPLMGEVLAVGTGRVNEDGSVQAVEVKVGDRVIFGKFAGTTVDLDGDEMMVISESDVLAVVE